MGCFISSKIEISGGINDWFPPEVLSKIFVYFTIEEQLGILSKVCTRWRDVVLNLCALRRYLHVSDSVQELVQFNKNIFASVQQLDVNITSPHILPSLTILLRSLDNLTVLRVGFTLKGANFSESSLVWSQAKTCFASLRCHIVRLEVVDCCRLTDRITAGRLAVTLLAHIAETSAISLKYLHYRRIRVPEENRDKILHLIANFRNLEVLNLCGCWLGPTVNRLSVSCRYLSHLKSIDIRRSRVLTNSELLASIIEFCPNIQCLGISPNIAASHTSICNLANCNNLTDILVDNCFVNPDNFDVIFKLLEVASEVKELKFGYFTDANMMWSLARIHIPTLEELDIYRSPNLVTDELVLEFSRQMPNLKRLIVSRCQKLTNEGLYTVITLLPKLQYINAGYNKNIDANLLELLKDINRETTITINAYACAISESAGVETTDRHVYIGKNQNVCVKWGL